MKFKSAYFLTPAIGVYQTALWPQQQREFSLVTKTSRPLVELSQALVLKQGWLVDYEDPTYTFLGDLIDVTQTQTSIAFRSSNPGKTIYGVRSRPVTFVFPFRSSSSALKDPAALIASLLVLNEQAGNPGSFKAISNGRHIQIVPVQVKNSFGLLSPSVNILDQPISFPLSVRSGSEIMTLIRDRLRNSNLNVGLGTVPTNYLNQTEMAIGATNEPARSVLIKLISGLHWRDTHIRVPTNQLVWRLLCAPDLPKSTFMINLEIARTEVDAPTGGQVVTPIH